MNIEILRKFCYGRTHRDSPNREMFREPFLAYGGRLSGATDGAVLVFGPPFPELAPRDTCDGLLRQILTIEHFANATNHIGRHVDSRYLILILENLEDVRWELNWLYTGGANNFVRFTHKSGLGAVMPMK